MARIPMSEIRDPDETAEQETLTDGERLRVVQLMTRLASLPACRFFTRHEIREIAERRVRTGTDGPPAPKPHASGYTVPHERVNRKFLTGR